MSSKAYSEAYSFMTEKQRDIMHDLWMKAENHDGHAWNMYCDIEEAVAGIVKEQMPPAQPTLYGYSIEFLAMVAEIMKKENVGPGEALQLFKSASYIAELVRAEWYENIQRQIQRQMEQMSAGGQDGTV